MKVIFLDVDGVLNNHRTAFAFGGLPYKATQVAGLDPVAIGMLQLLVRCDQSLKFVLSSTWRKDPDWEQLGPAMGLPIIDRTPYLGKQRGYEIQNWLDLHPEVEAYAILDDDGDMLPTQKDSFVHVRHAEGLLYSDFQDLCAILGINPFDSPVRNPAPWSKL